MIWKLVGCFVFESSLLLLYLIKLIAIGIWFCVHFAKRSLESTSGRHLSLTLPCT